MATFQFIGTVILKGAIMSTTALIYDQNHVAVPVREGVGVGGKLTIDVSPLTANAWYRLMPNGNTGVIDSTETYHLKIGALRDDLLDVAGWHIYILNSGYYQQLEIVEYDTDSQKVRFKDPMDFMQGLTLAELNDAIEFVMYPRLLSPLGVSLDDDANANIEFGFSKGDRLNPANLRIKAFQVLRPGKILILPFSRIDQLFYRFATLPIADTFLYWGEHYTG